MGRVVELESLGVTTVMHVRIISTPPGEAPERVRDAWIGLVLPLAASGQRDIETVGVLSAPKSRLGWFFARLLGRTRQERGYIVDAHQAVELLTPHAPDAARWWRESAASAVQPGQYFVFAAEVCQEVSP